MNLLGNQIAFKIKWLVKCNPIIERIARKTYNSEFCRRINMSVSPWRTKRDKEILISSQTLGNFKDMKSSLMYEVGNFFNISNDEILRKVNNGVKEEWFKKERMSKEQIEEFYENEIYLFDILKAKLNGGGFIGLRKIIGSLELALKLKDYLGFK